MNEKILTRKKCLFISPRHIFPIIGGDQIRSAQQLVFLTELFDVEVVYLSEQYEQDNYVRNFNPNINKSICFKRTKLQSFLSLFNTLLNGKPLQVNYFTDNRLKKYIKSVIDDYDFVFCSNTRVTQYVLNMSCTELVDLVDAASMNCLNAKSKAKGLKKIYYTIDSYLMKKYELLVIKKFDRCSIISDVDKAFLENG